MEGRPKRRQIRAVCIRSHLRAEASGVRLFACTARRPGSGPAPLWRRDVSSLGDVLAAADELRIDQPPETGWERVQESLILVCTNGRHDQCCANLGRPLVRALRDSSWADRVWECSHIGGDRFAANLVVLPDSLYFGRVDPASAPELLGALDQGRINLSLFRGRTSFSLAELKRLPIRSQITMHTCEEGWSFIAEWTGVLLSDVLTMTGVDARARYVVFIPYDQWWDSLELQEALHPQTQITFKFADEILPRKYGFPMKVRMPTKLGFKNPKHVVSLVVTNDYRGGYWEDQGYNWFSGL